jgi:hypothetical protein
VRFTDPARKDFASKTAVVFLDYLTKHYFPKLSETYCKTVGIAQMTMPELLLYPNPFNNVLSIQNSLPADIRIYNLLGELIISKKIGICEEIDLSCLKDGIYLVTLSSESKILHIEKIVKSSP